MIKWDPWIEFIFENLQATTACLGLKLLMPVIGNELINCGDNTSIGESIILYEEVGIAFGPDVFAFLYKVHLFDRKTCESNNGVFMSYYAK